MRRQTPIKGGRQQLPSCVLASIRAAVSRIANKHRVSRSWVVAVLLAHALGITDQEQYTSFRPQYKEKK